MRNITDTTIEKKQSRIDRPADFLQIDRSWMKDVALELTDTQLGTALRLIGYCFEYPDTQGVIKNAKTWSARRWSNMACGLDVEQLTNDVKDAWHWDGDDLIVDCCPSYVHSLMEHRTKGQMNGKKGAVKRWGAKKENIAPPIDSPIAEREKGEREGESSKSKEYVESRDSMETVERSGSHSMQHRDKQMKQKLSERESGRASDSISCSCSYEPEESRWSSSEQYADDSMEIVEDSASVYESCTDDAIARSFLSVIWKKLGYNEKYIRKPEETDIPRYIEKYRAYLPDLSRVPDIIRDANSLPEAINLLKKCSEQQKQDAE